MNRPGLMLLAAIGFAVSALPVWGAEQYELQEPTADTRVFRVVIQPHVTGTLNTATEDGKALPHDLNVRAELRYLERRLPGAGRDAEALRSLRQYDTAEAIIEVGAQRTSSRLRQHLQQVVARGLREGISLYCPQSRLSYEELELLRAPGDSLASLALLPSKAVEVGEKWSTPSWVAQMLTGTEAATKSELECTLEQVERSIARVKFTGRVVGASAGAAAEVDVSGHYLFDLNKKYIQRMEVTQGEQRTVGPVTPGLKVTAKSTMQRTLENRPGALTDAAAAAIPLEPEASQVSLEFRSPWRVWFEYDRNWHVFHQSGDVAVLRLLDKGSLIAQCNVSPVPNAASGQHTPEGQFQQDIRNSLGEKLTSIEKAEQIKTDDGRFLYRVTALGLSNKIPMQWIYYLCADPSGRQVALVFAVETELLEKLDNRDLGIVSGLKFLPEEKAPAKAAAR